MRIVFNLLVYLLFGVWLGGQTRQVPSAIVEFQVFTFVGDRLEDASVTLVERGTKKQLSQAFTVKEGRHVAPGIPYGEYELHVQRPGFRLHRQFLPIYQPSLSFRVFLRLARITDEASTEVIGTITAIPAKTEILWVKMFPLLTGEFIGEAEVESDGRFRITGLDAGEYLLVVMKGADCVYMKQLRVYGVVKPTIVLSSAPASK